MKQTLYQNKKKLTETYHRWIQKKIVKTNLIFMNLTHIYLTKY